MTPSLARSGGRRGITRSATSPAGSASSHHSNNFCGDCNRVRVTAEGKLVLCLGHEGRSTCANCCAAIPATASA